MAPNCKRPPWTDDELTALEEGYAAVHRWEDIARSVSAASGNHRSTNACRCRAQYLTISKGGQKGRVKYGDRFDGDIEDMMLLGYSASRIAEDLGTSKAWVTKRIRSAMSAQLRAAWMRKTTERRRQGVARAWIHRAPLEKDERGRFVRKSA